MITVRAGSAAIGVCLLLVTAGCSREQQDWRSAEAADSIDSYGQFIQRHPDSELVTQARARVAQLGEDRDWQRAGSADTVEAYREFIAQHPNGKWSQEAHIRVENFSLGEQAGTDAGTKVAAAAGSAAVEGRAASVGGPGTGASGSGAASAGGVARAASGAGVPAAGGASGAGAATAGGGSGAGVVTAGGGSGAGVVTAGGGSGAGVVTGARGRAGETGSASTTSVPSGAHSYGLAQPGEAATPTRARAPATAQVNTPATAQAGAPATAQAGAPATAQAAGVSGVGANAGSSNSVPVTRAGSASGTVPAPSGGRSGSAMSASARGGSAIAVPVKGGFGIQLGAYSNEAGASAQWRVLTARYGTELQGLQQHVVAAETGSGRIYRLQATVGDEGRARAICDQLKKHGQACVAVLPH